MAWMDAEKFVDHYLAGRSRNTFPTYKMAFRKLWMHWNEIGKLVFWWNDLEFAGHLVLLNENKASVNMFKQASAVMTMMKELVGLETVTNSRIVQNVKRGCLKDAKERAARKGKHERTVMTLDHVRLMMKKLYKRPVEKVTPANRRFLLQ